MKNGWTIICKIPGKHDWKELNELYKFQTGTDSDIFETEADYRAAIKEGFVEFDGTDTVFWADESY